MQTLLTSVCVGVHNNAIFPIDEIAVWQQTGINKTYQHNFVVFALQTQVKEKNHHWNVKTLRKFSAQIEPSQT